MVVGAPRIGEALDDARRVCRGRILVGHEIGFDLSVLSRIRSSTALDIMRLAAALHPDWQQFGFDDIASRMGIGMLGRHTAAGDALAAGEVLLALIPEIIARRLRTIGDLTRSRPARAAEALDALCPMQWARCAHLATKNVRPNGQCA